MCLGRIEIRPARTRDRYRARVREKRRGPLVTCAKGSATTAPRGFFDGASLDRSTSARQRPHRHRRGNGLATAGDELGERRAALACPRAHVAKGKTGNPSAMLNGAPGEFLWATRRQRAARFVQLLLDHQQALALEFLCRHGRSGGPAGAGGQNRSIATVAPAPRRISKAADTEASEADEMEMEKADGGSMTRT